MSLNWFDYTLIVLLLVFAGQGLARGFSRVAIGLAATVLGILLACWFYGIGAGFVRPWVANDAIANILGFLLVLFVVQGVGALIGWALNKMMKTVGLGWLDRVLGAGFGVLKAALVGIALALVLTAFPLGGKSPQMLRESRLAPWLADAAMVLSYATPHEIKTSFAKTYEHLQEFWRSHAHPGAVALETQTF